MSYQIWFTEYFRKLIVLYEKTAQDLSKLLQIKCEVIVKKTSQDASDARYGGVLVGPHRIWHDQSLSGGVMGRKPYTQKIYNCYEHVDACTD